MIILLEYLQQEHGGSAFSVCVRRGRVRSVLLFKVVRVELGRSKRRVVRSRVRSVRKTKKLDFVGTLRREMIKEEELEGRSVTGCRGKEHGDTLI